MYFLCNNGTQIAGIGSTWNFEKNWVFFSEYLTQCHTKIVYVLTLILIRSDKLRLIAPRQCGFIVSYVWEI